MKSSIWATSWEKLPTIEDDIKINVVYQSCSLKYLCHQSNTSLKAVTFPDHLVKMTTKNHKCISHHHSQRPMFLLNQSSWMICVSQLKKLQQSKTKILVNLSQPNHIRGKVCRIFFLMLFWKYILLIAKFPHCSSNYQQQNLDQRIIVILPSSCKKDVGMGCLDTPSDD